jgi:hypothetical protein
VLTRLAIAPRSDRALRDFGDERDSRFLNPEWLEIRVQVFLRTALASMERQTVSPDLWLIAVDERVEPYLNFLVENLPAYAKWVVLGQHELFPEVVRQQISHLLPDVLTIRLDSDDQLDPLFLARAARYSRPNFGINFPHGAQYFLASGMLVHRWIKSNPTVGFRAVNTDMTVHDFGNHPNVGRTARTISIPTWNPMWVKGSHDANHVYFQPNGIPVMYPRKSLSRFELFPNREAGSFETKLRTLISFFGFRLNKRWPALSGRLEDWRNRTR